VIGHARENLDQYLAPRLRTACSCLNLLETWEELRLRAGQPVTVHASGHRYFPTAAGAPGLEPERGFPVTVRDVRETLGLMTEGSAYALEECLAQGYLTLPGGHRVGVAGRAVLEGGTLRRLLDPGALNIRRNRPVPGAAQRLLHVLWAGSEWHNVLIISPPGCGKTTLLRDLIRLASDGFAQAGIPPSTVGVVDERSELAACLNGAPQLDVGRQTDVLDSCPKALGIMMLLRSMGPQIVATDELGRPEDAAAVREALNAGVRVFTTSHASCYRELKARLHLRGLLADRLFGRVVVLGRADGPGTVESVVDAGGREVPCATQDSGSGRHRGRLRLGGQSRGNDR